MRNIRFHVLIGLCAVANLLAQTDRGVITGTVKDVSGAVVPGAQVTAIQTNTNANFKTKTTTSGDFTVPSLPVGTYQVRVENTGFKTFLANRVEVAAGATVPLDVTMELGTTQQTVEVLANAQMLQTEAGRGATGGCRRVGGGMAGGGGGGAEGVSRGWGERPPGGVERRGTPPVPPAGRRQAMGPPPPPPPTVPP